PVGFPQSRPSTSVDGGSAASGEKGRDFRGKDRSIPKAHPPTKVEADRGRLHRRKAAGPRKSGEGKGRNKRTCRGGSSSGAGGPNPGSRSGAASAPRSEAGGRCVADLPRRDREAGAFPHFSRLL